MAGLGLEILHATYLCSDSEDCGHGDHDEQLGESLGEYGGAHEAHFGVPVVCQALCAERDDGVDDEGVAGDRTEGYEMRSGRLITLLRNHAAPPAKMA